VHIMPVAKVIEHPTHDIALGVVHATPEQAALMRPMTLAANTLPVGAKVAVLGYPHNRTDHKLDDDGVALSKLGFTPDFYEGRVEEHSFGGTGLVRRGPTYLADIAPPPWHFDLGGVSGGPMVSCENGDVHGIYSSGSPGSPDGPEGPGVPAYSIFTDIAVALDWGVLTDQQGRSLTIRELALASVDRSNPASRGRVKSGQSLQDRFVYIAAGQECKSPCSFVRQLRGPHLRRWAWWSRRSSMAVTAAVSPSSLPQSSTGRLEVRSVETRS
jgi:hypothetical protein